MSQATAAEGAGEIGVRGQGSGVRSQMNEGEASWLFGLRKSYTFIKGHISWR